MTKPKLTNSEELISALRSAARGDDHSGSVLALRHDDQIFTLKSKDKKRLELLAQVRAADGEPVELEVEIRAFQQQDGVSNRNFTRFKKGILRRLAKSFTGVPLLRDHDQGSIDARAGTVTSSKAVAIEGGLAFDMTARVTAPWAVEALLAGNLDRFSIGWDFPGIDTLQCSVCKCAVLTDCMHLPGDKLDDGGRAEFVFTEAEGVEVSGVSVPAVKGTGLEQVRSALSKAARLRLDSRDESAERKPMENIAKTLGLKEEADESTIVAGIGALQARAEQAETALKSEREAHAETAAKHSKLEEELTELRSKDQDREIDKLCADYADRFPVERDAEGNRTKSKLEAQIRVLAKSDIDGARAMLEAMQPVAPIVGEQSAKDELANGTEVPEVPSSAAGFTGNAKKQRAQLGLSDEDFAKYNPINGSETDHLRN